MLALVTGASGVLGRRFLATMATQHPQVRFRALVHVTPPPALDTVNPVAGALADEASLRSALQGVEAVVHFAARTHAARPEDYFTTNATGTGNLASASRKAGVQRFVLVSTRAIRPECGDYARSKLMAEEAVRESGVPHVILRLAEVYGAGSHEGLEALAATVRRFPLVPYPSGAARLAPLWIDDAVDAVVQALTRPHLREDRYTIAGPRTYTLEAIIELLAAGLAVRRIGVPLAAVLFRMASRMPLPGGGRVVRYDQIARLQCPKDSDIAAARRDLGFAPVDFEHGVARLLAGVRERH